MQDIFIKAILGNVRELTVKAVGPNSGCQDGTEKNAPFVLNSLRRLDVHLVALSVLLYHDRSRASHDSMMLNYSCINIMLELRNLAGLIPGMQNPFEAYGDITSLERLHEWVGIDIRHTVRISNYSADADYEKYLAELEHLRQECYDLREFVAEIVRANS